MIRLFILMSIFFTQTNTVCSLKYEPTWESLDNRIIPKWYDEVKVGIFIHWGVFSVPALNAWFWSNWKLSNNPLLREFMEKNYKPNFTYQEFAPMFTAEFFNPNKWAEIFQKSGAKYVVLTSKHHEGYTLWPSKNSWNWNSVDVGPKRDIIKELKSAVENSGMHFGLYHSLYEWFNPLYLYDKKNLFKTQEFVNSKTMPELYDLVNTYKPEIIWSDGEWEAFDTYWKSKEFLAWLYNDSPVKDFVVTNDRWGLGTLCKHGGFWTCQDRYNPGKLQKKKWENAMTLDKSSWGYNRNSSAANYLTIEELLTTLAQTISYGGNLLINVGPTSDGRIPPIMEERLMQFGSWMEINGNAIYKTVPWTYQNDTLTKGVWYTRSAEEGKVFAIVTVWPTDGLLRLKSLGTSLIANIMFRDKKSLEKLSWKRDGGVVEISFPNKTDVKWAWVLEINIQK